VKTRVFILLCTIAALGTCQLAAQTPPDPDAVPWGIATSAHSTGTFAEWAPKVSSIGIVWVRAFDEWGSLEPNQGSLYFAPTDALVDKAEANHLQLSGLFFGSPKWAAPSSHTFAMDHLDDWSHYANAVTAHYKGRIRYWEVWNEGNAGFNDGHNTAADYARLVSAAYAGAKKADPDAQIGLSVASFDAPYIGMVANAQAASGFPGQFDYVCLHPYEILDGLRNPDGEILYLWMSHMLRDELKATAPNRADVPVWITEVSRHISDKVGAAIPPGGASPTEEAARTLVKAYVLALAQGITRVCWFEAKDPIGEEAGFGLLQSDGTERPSYIAMKSLIAALGETPKYLGWLALGDENRGYGFVFRGANEPVLIVWMPTGIIDASIRFNGEVQLLDPITEITTRLGPNSSLRPDSAPIIVTHLPDSLVAEAKANATKPFPWGGNYSSVSTVSFECNRAHKSEGIFQLYPRATPAHIFDDGSSGITLQGDFTHPVSFYTHPSFASVTTREYYIRVTFRRITPGNVGWNFHYEVADSHAQGPMRSTDGWFSAGPDMGWQTHTWHVTDASFSKMWGYDFSINPEKSVPFVIGKIEVSTHPFP
jgi:hypothetical protein